MRKNARLKGTIAQIVTIQIPSERRGRPQGIAVRRSLPVLCPSISGRHKAKPSADVPNREYSRVHRSKTDKAYGSPRQAKKTWEMDDRTETYQTPSSDLAYFAS